MAVRADVNILVVDDVVSVRKQLRDLLKETGFERIAMAGSGQEAKQALGESDFDLVLCDWHMGPIDGLNLLKFIRRNPQLCEIPFIMVTAESTKERVIEAVQAGVDEYILKPLTMAQIQNKVFKVLFDKQVL